MLRAYLTAVLILSGAALALALEPIDLDPGAEPADLDPVECIDACMASDEPGEGSPGACVAICGEEAARHD